MRLLDLSLGIEDIETDLRRPSLRLADPVESQIDPLWDGVELILSADGTRLPVLGAARVGPGGDNMGRTQEKGDYRCPAALHHSSAKTLLSFERTGQPLDSVLPV